MMALGLVNKSRLTIEQSPPSTHPIDFFKLWHGIVFKWYARNSRPVMCLPFVAKFIHQFSQALLFGTDTTSAIYVTHIHKQYYDLKMGRTHTRIRRFRWHTGYMTH